MNFDEITHSIVTKPDPELENRVVVEGEIEALLSDLVTLTTTKISITFEPSCVKEFAKLNFPM